MSVPEAPLIRVRDLSLGYGDRVILNGVHLDIPPVGVMAIMGPSGVGKSALVRALTKQNDHRPNFWVSGEVLMRGVDLLVSDLALIEEWCPLLAQKARLYAGTVLQNVLEGTAPGECGSASERLARVRHAFHKIGLWPSFEPLLNVPVETLSMAKHKQVLLARLMVKAPPCVFVDEPSADISLVEEEEIHSLLKTLGKQIAVILVTHNKQVARAICDTICLITGGRLVETTPTDEFFSAPRTELGREFLQSGSCWPQGQDTETEKESVAKQSSIPKTKRLKAPMLRDFHWAIPGVLGGMQQPGLLGDADADIAVLKELGVSIVVNLTEKPLYVQELERVGIRSVHFPIPDMGIPDLHGAVDFCQNIVEWIDQGLCTVFHCRAGMGRTGTMLACALVCRGQGPIRSIEALRKINPGYIQTEEQFAFIGEFANYLDMRLAG